jgi:ABC-type sugar transport system ATPase subunit
MTVYDNLAFGLKMRKIPKDEIRKRVEHAAELLDIGELLERKPRALSGGQRQRVALGRALVREPAAFLMDEPLSNLDAKLRVQTRSEIKQLQRQVGTTTVYVTHDQVEAMTMGDRVAVMNNGLLEQVGDTRTVYEHPANVFVAGFIGSPGMTFATLDASRNGGPVTLARGGVSLSVDPAGATEPLPGEVTIGIRPEHAHVWRDGGDLMGPIEGTVTFVEMLGREALLGVQVGDDQRFTVFADADAQTAIGDLLSFGIERGRLYLFDPTDEHALGVV